MPGRRLPDRTGRRALVSTPTGNPVANRTLDDAAVRSAMAGAGLPRPSRVRLSDQSPQVTVGTQTTGGRLFFRDGATAQITPVGRTLAGPGVWLQAGMATRLGARVGSPVTISAGGITSAGVTSTRVVGIYKNLDEEAVRPYWCSYTNLFLNPSYGNDSSPPPLVIAADSATFQSLRDGYGGSSTESWVSPADTTGITLTQGQAIADKQEAAYRALNLPPPQTVAALNSGTGQMPQFVARTLLIRGGLRGPVVPIALGGSVLALLLVGAAGSYWADRRAREVRLLSSRAPPAALAVKAVLELAVPAVAGTVLGWVVARWLVAVLGPSPLIDRAAPPGRPR